VRWVIERLEERWGERIEWEHDSGNHLHEAHYLLLDSSKARSRLGWEPLWDLEQGLASIVDWYRAFQRGEDARRLVVSQIEQFQTGARAMATGTGSD
jgi:CDP-glucose 4,6-dehydratase